MLGRRKHLYVIIGCLAVGIAAVLIVYFAMISAGIIQTTTDRLVISTADAEKTYDGTPLTCEEFTVSEGSLPKGYTVKAIFTSERTEAGTAENFATAVVYDTEGADVTSKYEIEYKYGTLTVLPIKLEYFTQNASKIYDGLALVSTHVEKSAGELLAGHSCEIEAYGARTEIGQVETRCEWKVSNAVGEDMSHNYELVYTPGVLTVRPRPLSFYSNDAEKIFDGKPLEATHYEQIGGTLLSGHRMEVVLKGARTDVGITESVLFVNVTDASGQDVSSFYEVDYRPGKLTVTGRPIIIQTESDEKIYDGTELTKDGWSHIGGDLLPGHSLEVTVAGKRTKVGKSYNVAGVRVKDGDGLDVTRNYAIEFEYGILNVKGIPINLYSYDAEKEYDGTPLTEPRTPEVTGDLMMGHMVKAEAIGSQTEVGKSYNFMEAAVYDAAGEDVSSYYELIFNYGILTVLEPESERNSDEYMIINSSIGGDIYLRETAYGNYVNGAWYGQKRVYDSSDTLNPLFLSSTAIERDGSLATGTLSITLWRSTAKYTVPYYCTTYSAPPANDVSPEGEFVRNEPYTVNMTVYEYSDDTIGNYSVSPEYATLEAKYSSFVKSNYLDVSPEIRVELERILNENGLYASSPTIVSELLEYVSKVAKYKIGVEVPEGKDPILYFLEEGKEGKCTDFAGAATLMFRTLGIPARIVTGFLVVDAKPNVDITVKGSRAHAWTEIYIDGIGWVHVDPTPGDGGARGGDAISVRPADESRYWTASGGELQHSGTIYAENGVISAIKQALELGFSSKVVLERVISSPTLTKPGMAEATITRFRVLVDGALAYEYSGGVVSFNPHELKFSFDTGELKYYKYKITVTTTGTQSKVYDGSPMLFNSLSFGMSWTIESEYDPSVSKADMDLNCKLVIPNDMVDVGRAYIAVSDLSISSPIHASDYHVVYNYAYAEITRKSATVTVDENGDYVAEGLLPGHSLSQCNVNFENNVFDIVITDEGSRDVTNNYQLTLKLY